MQFGAQLVNYVTTWKDTRATLETIEAGRFNSAWFSDHFLLPNAPREREGEPAFEAWSMLTAAAVATRRLRLGVMVTGNTYRNPALLAKMCATVDHISDGRLELGIGAAWFQREHEAYGWDFPSIKERCDRLEEAVEVIRMLFTADEAVDYAGIYYRLDQAPFAPGCTQQPHIPILVGGNGEKRTLRTCARFADICNIDFWNPGGPDVFRAKLEVLAKHCEDFGRDPTEIKKTMLIPLRIMDDESKAEEVRKHVPWFAYGSVAYIQDLLHQYIEAGAEEIMFASIPSQAELWQRVDEEILSAFD